ncbi:MAG: YegS/Rv2252/BmrU family lipid kinase [Rhodospirillaceae bacterium]|nr:YegS/Rv2252/BmrU family lipid kinase [Rhodospirillaceae bacterium]
MHDLVAANGVVADAGIGAMLVIYNPTAGHRRARFLARVTSLLADRGVALRTVATAARGDATKLARAANAAATVAAAGGDGTINEVINGLDCRRARLAVIPLGTANVLAAELGLSARAESVAAAAAAGRLRHIHLGEVRIGRETRRFAMMAGVGFDAHVVAHLPLKLKRALANISAGKLAYAWQMLVEWLRLRPRRYRVTADGADYDCASAIVAKGHFYGGRYVAAPEASLDRDSFELVLFERGGRWAVLRYAVALGLGRLHRAKGVRILRVREIEIAGAAGEPVHADGDCLGTLPARFTIAPETLAVLAP